MSRIVRTSSNSFGPSVVDFDRLPCGRFTLQIEAHGVVLHFTDVVVSKGCYSKDRIVEAKLASIDTMFDNRNEPIADDAMIDSIRRCLREWGILAFDAMEDERDCYSLREDAGSKDVALREFSKSIIEAVKVVLDARKPKPKPPQAPAITATKQVSVTDFMNIGDADFSLVVAANGIAVRFDHVTVVAGRPNELTGYLTSVLSNRYVPAENNLAVVDELNIGSHSIVDTKAPTDRGYPIRWSGGALPHSRTFCARDFSLHVLAAIEAVAPIPIAA